MEEEKLKEIISVFIKVPAGQIGPATAIGRSALGSSILLHRMFAKLTAAGWAGDNYSDINVYADLWPAGRPADGITMAPTLPAMGTITHAEGLPGVGIDMEEISAMPETQDFRATRFYQMNFTPAEIAYCILQADPYSSFAGLFAAKEAIVKADSQFRSRSFNTITIDHSPDGKPLCPGFGLSISHAGGMAVAIAQSATNHHQLTRANDPIPLPDRPAPSSAWIAWLALLLAVVALVIVLTH
jgi:phosphopantetheine--protein transferase-like protein